MSGSREYFAHDADVGVIGRGASLEEAFVAAAEAVFALQTDLAAVHERESLAVAFDEADAEFALVAWLNALLGGARERDLALARFTLEHEGEHWRGEARGEPWRAGLERGVEVKGATLTMLTVKQGAQGWEARCVVDV